jgi:hypothetical protein
VGVERVRELVGVRAEELVNRGIAGEAGGVVSEFSTKFPLTVILSVLE